MGSAHLGLTGPFPSYTLMTPNVHLTKEGELFKDPKRYRRLVGKLNYLTVTCSDISYSVSVLSRYVSFPIVSHWASVEISYAI